MSPYTHGHAEPVLRSHVWRTVANSAAYLVPKLRPGMRVLDVGCGPGTITLDLARHVAPGTVVGLDPAPAAVEAASAALAAARTSGEDLSVELVCGRLDTYPDGGFDGDFDGDFDVVHAHQVLQHLADPVAALRAMGRLCRPEGQVAVRDADYAAFCWFPEVPALEEWRHLYRTVARSCRGEPDAGRRLLSWARQAGLRSVRASASTWCFATPQDRAWWGDMWADRIVDSDLARRAVDDGVAATADLQRMRRGWQQWAEAEDGWLLVPHGEILANPPG